MPLLKLDKLTVAVLLFVSTVGLGTFLNENAKKEARLQRLAEIAAQNATRVKNLNQIYSETIMIPKNDRALSDYVAKLGSWVIQPNMDLAYKTANPALLIVGKVDTNLVTDVDGWDSPLELLLLKLKSEPLELERLMSAGLGSVIQTYLDQKFSTIVHFQRTAIVSKVSQLARYEQFDFSNKPYRESVREYRRLLAVSNRQLPFCEKACGNRPVIPSSIDGGFVGPVWIRLMTLFSQNGALDACSWLSKHGFDPEKKFCQFFEYAASEISANRKLKEIAIQAKATLQRRYESAQADKVHRQMLKDEQAKKDREDAIRSAGESLGRGLRDLADGAAEKLAPVGDSLRDFTEGLDKGLNEKN